MDELSRAQTKRWTIADLASFDDRYLKIRGKSCYGGDTEEVKFRYFPEIPFSSSQTSKLRAESYLRKYRSGFLRFLPSGILLEDLDASFKLGGFSVQRGMEEFRRLAVEGAYWVGWIPLPISGTRGVRPEELDSLLQETAYRLEAPLSHVRLPNLATLQFLFMLEHLYDDYWPHGRTIEVVSSTVVDDVRYGLRATFDGRLRLDVLSMRADCPFEGGIAPLIFPEVRLVAA